MFPPQKHQERRIKRNGLGRLLSREKTISGSNNFFFSISPVLRNLELITAVETAEVIVANFYRRTFFERTSDSWDYFRSWRNWSRWLMTIGRLKTSVGTSNPRVRGIENCIVGNVATNASTESTKDRTMLIVERNNTRECSRDQITVQIVRLKDYSLIVARTRLCTHEIGLLTLYLRCALVQKFRIPIYPST